MMTTPEVFQIPVSGDVGYIREWKPQKRTMVMIAQIQEIMAEWEAEKVTPVKNRTLFYRMGVLHGYPKTEAYYKNTINPLLTKMRRADPDFLPDLWLDWELLIDFGAIPPKEWFYDSPAEFWRVIEIQAKNYRIDPLDGQNCRFIIWLEAGGLVAAAQQGVERYGVPVATGGRQDSYYMKRKAAEWIAEQGVPVTVFHIGDYDGQGIEIFNNLAEDVPALVSEISDVDVDFVRLGVNSEHVAKGGVLHSSVRDPKGTPADIRQSFNDKQKRVLHPACEAEAFNPVDIRAMVAEAVESRICMEIFEKNAERQAEEHAEIQQVITDGIAA
jgi:hypothetical protein